jgi:hypothetical protein
MTRENLDNAINQTTLEYSNADQLYAKAEQTVSAAMVQEWETPRFDLPPGAG